MLLIDSPEAMRALGEALGRAVGAGDVIGLVGDLGAGKTLLVQGLAAGLGVPPEVHVTSPTFTLVHTYEGGRVPLHHVDLYRLEREEELEDVGLDDLYRQDAVVAVEWFDRFPPGVAERLELHVEIVSATARRVRLEAHGARAEKLAAELRP
jgi:tRNA threonylcarbamoyladenosine biosynthesis protein TsaE